MSKRKTKKKNIPQTVATVGNKTTRSNKIFLPAILIFIAAFVLRLLFLNSNPDRDWPYSIFYFGDSHHFHQYAVSLLEGKDYDQRIPYHPPMFAWFLALLYFTFGIPNTSGEIFKICFSLLNAATVLVAWIWYRNSLGERWAIPATLMLATHFGWLVFSVTPNNEVLYAVFLVLTLALTWSNRFALSTGSAVFLGIIMAAASLTRAEHLSTWPLVLIYLFLLRDRNRIFQWHFYRWCLAVLVCGLCILPWAVRNAVALTEFNRQHPGMEPLSIVASVTAYGPVNFAMANNELADGGFKPDLITRFTGGAGALDLKLPEHRDYFIHGYARGWDWILNHPGDFASLVLKKLDRFIDGLAIGFGVSNVPGGLTGNRPPVDLFIPDSKLLKYPFLILIVLGMVLSFLPKHRELLICTLFLLHRLFVTTLFFGYARGFVVLLPAAVPLMLLPMLWLSRNRSEQGERFNTYLSTGVAVLILIQAVAAVVSPRDYMSSGSVDERGKIIQDSEVRLWPKRDKS